MTTTELNAPREMRNHKVDPRAITIEEGFNTRIKYKGIDELMSSIIENGVKVPLRGKRVEKNKFILTDGHRRLTAIMQAIENGHEIAYVPFIIEPKGYSEEKRIADLITMNSGMPLNEVEEAEVFRRLINIGWTQEQIAKQIGKTQAHVSGRLKISEFSRYIKDLLIDDVIRVSLANEVVENYPKAEDQKKVLTGAIKKMKALGKQRVVSELIKKPRIKKTTDNPEAIPTSHDRIGKYHKLFEDSITLLKEKKWHKRKIDKVIAFKKLLDAKDPQAFVRALSKMAI